MQTKRLWILTLLLGVLWGCGKEDEPVITGLVSGKVTDANTDAVLEGVRIIVFESNENAPVTSLTSDAEGMYSAELPGGSYYLKLYRNGYKQVPPKGMSPLPFTVTVGAELSKSFEMNPSQVQNGGYIKGKVSEGAAGVPGVLVVAEKDGQGYSAITDAAGDFYIYNLPADSYVVKGWLAGYSSEEQTVSITSSAESIQNLELTKGAAGSVTGTLSFLATDAVEVDVTLVHPATGEAIPGLLTKSAQDFSLTNVPDGTYLARASYQNDARVVDPDWIIKFGEPVVTISGAEVNRNFSLTNAVSLSAPTNAPETTEPFMLTTATPEFSWVPYSSSSDYVIEVSDANGNVIWGGFREGASGIEKVVSVPSSQTSVIYNFDGSATSELLPGKVYRWRVYASKNDTKEASGWKLISVSEDQRGLIQVGE